MYIKSEISWCTLEVCLGELGLDRLWFDGVGVGSVGAWAFRGREGEGVVGGHDGPKLMCGGSETFVPQSFCHDGGPHRKIPRLESVSYVLVFVLFIS